MWHSTCPFILKPMPQVLDIGFFDNDFVHSSNQYNNILATTRSIRIHCLHRRFRDVRDCYFMTLEQFSVNNRN